jgi:hypothetical protein
VAEYSGALTGLLPQHQHVAVALPVRMVKAPLAGEYARSPVGAMFQLVARFVCPVRTQDRFIGMVVGERQLPRHQPGAPVPTLRAGNDLAVALL